MASAAGITNSGARNDSYDWLTEAPRSFVGSSGLEFRPSRFHKPLAPEQVA
jgi:hypothetical protein